METDRHFADGSEASTTRHIVSKFLESCPSRAEDVYYMHEQEVALPGIKNDHTLRHIVHRRIRELYGQNSWIIIAHPDEFYYHDPRLVAALAEKQEADFVYWYSLQVLPHPGEEVHSDQPLVQQRFQHFHHNFNHTGAPFMEPRMFKDNPEVEYTDVHYPLPVTGLKKPFNHMGHNWEEALQMLAEAYAKKRALGLVEGYLQAPVLLHYKVTAVDPSRYIMRWYESSDETYRYPFWAHRTHFNDEGMTAPVGLSFNVNRAEGFFVETYENFQNCTRFTGCLQHEPWAMSEVFRAQRRWVLQRENDDHESYGTCL
eukprot:gene7189-8570_t